MIAVSKENLKIGVIQILSGQDEVFGGQKMFIFLHDFRKWSVLKIELKRCC